MSQWLKQKEKELNAIRKPKKKNIPFLVSITTFTIGFFVFMALINQANTDGAQTFIPIVFTIAIVAIILIICIVYTYISSDRKLKKYLYSLLTSPEEIALFDSEMLAPPLCNLKFTASMGEVTFTKHFLLYAFGPLSTRNYQIIKLQDIKVAKTYISSAPSNMIGFSKKYETSFFDSNNNIIGGVDTFRQEEHDSFINALCLSLPDLSLEQGRRPA